MSTLLSQLHRLVVERASLSELQTLCFDLGVNFDDLPGEALSDKARELILKLGRQRQLDRFLTTLAQTRPDLSDEAVLSADDDTLGALYAALPSFADAGLPPLPAPGEPPFKGLQYFDQADAHLFFGRETLTAKLVGRLRDTPSPVSTGEGWGGGRFLAVVGASGSGKSSVVRAGLIPALQRGEPLADGTLPPEGCADWPVHVFTPTPHPLEALAASLTRDSESVTATATLIDDLAQDPRSLHLYVRKILSRAPSPVGAEEPVLSKAEGDRSGGRLLLVVDQFEELFTLCRDPAERQAFVDNLLTAVSCETQGPTALVITLRADFYAHCAQYEGLRDALEGCQAYIGPMSEEELRRAIEQPAIENDWAFEPGLVDLMLRDVGDEPGALPLLSHALLETWKRRQGRALTLEGYHEAGGVQGAIAKTAESVFRQRLTPEQQPIARNIFLRLTELGEGTQDTRRRADLAELIPRPEDAPQVEAVLKTLADARLVTTSEGAAEVAHEALIREWPTLRRWLDENRAALRTHRQLNEDARDWEALNRDPGALYRGARLEQANEWAEAHGDEMNALERAFLEASRAAVEQAKREKEAARQRELEAAQKLAAAQQRRAETVRKALIGVVALLLVAVGATVLAVVQQQESKRNADRAQDQARQARYSLSGQLAAQAEIVFKEHSHQSLLLAIEALNITLREGEPRVPAAESALRRALTSFVGHPLSGHTGGISAVAISPDSRWLVTGDGASTARLWDLTADDPAAASIVLPGHRGGISAVAISSDSNWLITSDAAGTAYLWYPRLVSDAFTPLNLGSLVEGITAVAISPDNRWIVTGGATGTVQLWEASRSDSDTWPFFELPGHEIAVSHLAVSPDSHWLVSGDYAGKARLWDLTADDPSAAPLDLLGHEAAIWHIVISPDSRWLITNDGTGKVCLWDLTTGNPIELPDYVRGITAVAISPDSRWLVAGDGAGSARLWDLTADDPAAASIDLPGHIVGISAVVVSPDSRWLVTGDISGAARLWNLAAEDPAAAPIDLPRYMGSINAVAISPDNHWLAIGDGLGVVGLWDLTAEDPSAAPIALPGHEQSISQMAISPDNHWLVTGDRAGVARLWDLTADDPVAAPVDLPRPRGPIWGIAVSSDNHRLVTADNFGSAQLWDLTADDPAAAPVALPGHEGGITVGIISPDDHWLVIGSGAGVARLWNLTADDPSAAPVALPGHEGGISVVAISPDNHWLVTGDISGTARLWDLTAEDPAAAPIDLPGHKKLIWAVGIGPDNRWLVTSDVAHTTRLWDLMAKDPSAAPTDLTDQTGSAWVRIRAVSPDNHWMVTDGSSGAARLWDLTASDPSTAPINLPGHEIAVQIAAISPDNHWLVTVDYGSVNGVARLWDLTAEDPAAAPVNLPQHKGSISTSGFSPDSHWLFIGDETGTARLWDLTAGDPSAAPTDLPGHKIAVSAAAFSPDNRWLVTGDRAGVARLWDLAAGDPAAAPIILRGHRGAINAIVFSPDNHWLVIGDAGGTMRLWTLRLDELLDLACRTVKRNLTREEWDQFFPGQPYRKACEQWPMPGSQ